MVVSPPQVRLSASVACRELLASASDEAAREIFYPVVLPRLCLNRYSVIGRYTVNKCHLVTSVTSCKTDNYPADRYYMAEGVKLYCQETWRATFGSEGKAMVERYISR